MHTTPLAELKITVSKVISFTSDLLWTSGVKEHISPLNLGSFLNLSLAVGSDCILLPIVYLNMLAASHLGLLSAGTIRELTGFLPLSPNLRYFSVSHSLCVCSAKLLISAWKREKVLSIKIFYLGLLTN